MSKTLIHQGLIIHLINAYLQTSLLQLPPNKESKDSYKTQAALALPEVFELYAFCYINT
jgi:hypothetical protein